MEALYRKGQLQLEPEQSVAKLDPLHTAITYKASLHTRTIRIMPFVQARQKWHITGEKGFASSSNARNELMLRDAGEFAGHIKKCEKDIRILKNATEGLACTQGTASLRRTVEIASIST